MGLGKGLDLGVKGKIPHPLFLLDSLSKAKLASQSGSVQTLVEVSVEASGKLFRKFCVYGSSTWGKSMVSS